MKCQNTINQYVLSKKCQALYLEISRTHDNPLLKKAHFAWGDNITLFLNIKHKSFP